MEINVSEAKARLRTQILQNRSKARSSETSTSFTKNLLGLCKQLGAKTVAVYLSFGTEPDTRAFITLAQLEGVELVAPRITGERQMEMAILDGETQMGEFGLEQPSGSVVSRDQLDLIIAPALAVSKNGIRLGRGAGYFDRYLEGCQANVVAVVYSTELLDEVPSEEHDQRVDYILTEDGIFECLQ